MDQDAPQVPALMSLEGRAQMIADEAGKIDHAGDPKARRKAVYEAALANLRVVAARATSGQVPE